jgi:hypothetical protein
MRLRVSVWVGLCVTATLLIIRPSALFSADLNGRLRSSHPTIALSIAEADKHSPRFHKLLEDIGRTDGIVYVEAGECGHGVRACLPHKIVWAGPRRLLFILIDPYDVAHSAPAHLAGIIAHEVQHALEFLSDANVTNAAAMFMFYKRDASARGTFETAAAVLVSNRVSREVTDALRRRQ